ncbi:ETS homologous factor-like [Aethina tumida]|uniref:ETS homologous factor-like n=1 Tax=Aethina tumida TaxID=116153 RepID=UPI0021481C0D|nr:ETS homologous factor-like [Aethina tumida]
MQDYRHQDEDCYPLPISMEDIPSELLGIFGDISTPPDYYKQPMETWDAYQVTDFLRRETWCPDCNFNIDSFHSVSGYIFRHLSPTQCEAFLRSKEHGKHIYDIKENFLNNWNRDDYFNPPSPLDVNNNSSNDSIDASLPSNKNLTSRIRRPGRPRTHPHSFTKCERKSFKIWEFLINLLKNKTTCPSLIRWVDFEEGKFMFVRPEEVSSLWGRRKMNLNMTYEKFSRAMRYYYKSQVLLPVPGQRLVYKFGPLAVGWNKIQPIY